MFRLRSRSTIFLLQPRTPRRLIALALVASMPVLLTGCGGGNTTPGDPLGGIFGDLEATVNSVVEKAGAEADFTVLASAGQVQTAINQAESAYATQMTKTLDKVDDTTKANVERLRTLVDDLNSGVAANIADAGREAQQLLNTIPFANKNPQVTSYSPQFAASKGQIVQLGIHGNFVYAFQEKKTPYLVINGAKIEPNLVTTQDLGFSVPASAFPTSTNQPVPVSLELDAPYEKGAVFKSIKPGVFRLLVVALPTSPVKSATLTKESTTTGVASANRRNPEVGGWGLNSYDCNDHTGKQAWNATPGWTINAPTAHFVYDFNKNPSAASADVAASEANIVLEYATRPACFLGICNGCGSIVIHVEWQEQQTTSSTTEETKDLSLNWSDTVVEPVPKNRWKLHLVLFDGSTADFTASDHTNKYVIVDDEATAVRIHVRAPEELRGA